MTDKEISIADYLQILKKRKKFIFSFIFVVTLLVVIYTLLMPLTYKSTSVIMPPFNERGSSMLSSLANIPFLGMGIGNSETEIYTYTAILESRTVMNKIVDQYNLMNRYGTQTKQDAIRILRQNSSFDYQEEGTLHVTVLTSTGWLPNHAEKNETAVLAKNIANSFVSLMDSVYKTINNEQARNYRMFIEKRYEENLADLKSAEENLKEFQEKHDIISLDAQTETAIQVAGNLQAQIIAAKIQYRSLLETVGKNHPEAKKLEIQINELNNQLKEMELGQPMDESGKTRVFPSFEESPELGVKFIRLKRELEVQNELYKFLTQKYEEAKIQESKNTPTVQVLDRAVQAERKFKPKRAKIVIAFFILSIGMSIFLAFFLEYYRNIKSKK